MRFGYHSVEKKNAVTTDATVVIATQVAGSAIAAFQAMLEIMLVVLSIDPRRQVPRHLAADSESKLERLVGLDDCRQTFARNATQARVMDRREFVCDQHQRPRDLTVAPACYGRRQ